MPNLADLPYNKLLRSKIIGKELALVTNQKVEKDSFLLEDKKTGTS